MTLGLVEVVQSRVECLVPNSYNPPALVTIEQLLTSIVRTENCVVHELDVPRRALRGMADVDKPVERRLRIAVNL